MLWTRAAWMGISFILSLRCKTREDVQGHAYLSCSSVQVTWSLDRMLDLAGWSCRWFGRRIGSIAVEAAVLDTRAPADAVVWPSSICCVILVLCICHFEATGVENTTRNSALFMV